MGEWLIGGVVVLLLIYACIGMAADDRAVPDSAVLATLRWSVCVAAISGWPLFKAILEPLWELL